MKNRWWNFSLRTLLVVVTQFAVAFAIAPTCVKRYQRWQREHQFDALIELITTTVIPTSSGPYDDDSDEMLDDVLAENTDSAR